MEARKHSAGHRSASTFATIGRHRTFQNDESILARLGKKQTLRVRICSRGRRHGRLTRASIASLWFLVDVRIQLYNPGNVGNCLSVGIALTRAVLMMLMDQTLPGGP
jgi:hypothetical protein